MATSSAASDSSGLTVGSRANAKRPIELDATLLVLSQQFEPAYHINKKALEKDLLSRERTLLATQL
jgi:hypothetical protein